MESCGFQTSNPRARAPHLLRVHQLLFQSHGRPPIPLPAAELNERLAALKIRQRGSRQRRRDAAKAATGTARVGGASPVQPPQGQVAGAPTSASFLSSVAMDKGYGDSPLSDVSEFDEENWEDSVVDVLQLDDDDWEREFWGVVSPEEPTGIKLVPWTLPEPPEAPKIPGGLSPRELVQRILSSSESPTVSDIG